MEAPLKTFWLITSRRDDFEVLTVRYRGEREVMPVFGGAGEAEQFLSLYGAFGGGFRLRRSGADEVASLLLGPFSHVEKVVLDPSPGMDAEETIELVSMERLSFVHFLSSTAGTALVRMEGKRDLEFQNRTSWQDGLRRNGEAPEKREVYEALRRLFSERSQVSDFDARALSLLLWLRGYLPNPPPEQRVAAALRVVFEDRRAQNGRVGGAA